jgi:hypothetical protein
MYFLYNAMSNSQRLNAVYNILYHTVRYLQAGYATTRFTIMRGNYVCRTLKIVTATVSLRPQWFFYVIHIWAVVQ